MHTVWIAEHQDGYTYTSASFDLKTEETAQQVAEILSAEGYTVEVLPHGTMPSYYQAPTDLEGTTPQEFAVSNNIPPLLIEDPPEDEDPFDVS